MKVYGNHPKAGTKGRDIQPLFDGRKETKRVKHHPVKVDGVKYRCVKDAAIAISINFASLSHFVRVHGNGEYKGHKIERIYQ